MLGLRDLERSDFFTLEPYRACFTSPRRPREPITRDPIDQVAALLRVPAPYKGTKETHSPVDASYRNALTRKIENHSDRLPSFERNGDGLQIGEVKPLLGKRCPSMYARWPRHSRS